MRESNHKTYIITTHKVLTPDEQVALYKNCERSSLYDPDNRNGIMLKLMLETGMRATELTSIQIQDVAVREDALFIRSLKGSNARELPVRPALMRQIVTYALKEHYVENWNDIPKDAKLFQIGYHRLAAIWDNYRPNPKKSLHSLRHTFAVNLYEKTQNIKVVQIALGHRNINNTLVYLDFFYAQRSLRHYMHGK